MQRDWFGQNQNSSKTCQTCAQKERDFVCTLLIRQNCVRHEIFEVARPDRVVGSPILTASTVGGMEIKDEVLLLLTMVKPYKWKNTMHSSSLCHLLDSNHQISSPIFLYLLSKPPSILPWSNFCNCSNKGKDGRNQENLS